MASEQEKDDLPSGRFSEEASLLLENILRQRRHDEDSLSVESAPCISGQGPFESMVVSPGGISSGHSASTSTPGPVVGLPGTGDSLFGFHLLHQLGHGSFARVFLAAQSNLAGRRVVLKVSALEGSEHHTLAQLQHTHIVPIHSVHEDPRLGVRAVCMPYFGGASLNLVMEKLWVGPTPPRSGKELAEALRTVQGPPATEKEALKGSSSSFDPLTTLAEMNYVQACCWIVARLAEGLQHAHQRGVLHRDIKPSNILLAADGTPLLLDFNLAQDDGDPSHTIQLGGTIAYMAPEHLRAVASRNVAQARLVKHQADVYSLGMVLYEMLTGHRPFDQTGSYMALPVLVEAMALERGKASPSLRETRPDLSWSLESIVKTCLHPDPASRYARPEELAEDLRRTLTDQPLRYAPELSLVERAQKWSRRHPRLSYGGGVAFVALLLLASILAVVGALRGRLADAEDQLATAAAIQRRQAFEAGTTRALCLVHTTMDQQDHLREGTRVTVETLGLYDLLQGHSWQEHPDWSRFAAEERRVVAEDARELLLLLAWARTRAQRDDPGALREALDLLDRAEAVGGLGPSRAQWLDRCEYLTRLGDLDRAANARRRAEETPPVDARDHYLLATAWARKGTPDALHRAVTELDRAIELNPRHYWSWVQRGLCHQERGDLVQAAADFGTCIGLRPDFAWGHFCRGWLLAQHGRKADAIRDYSAALERDPGLVPAHINRGLAYQELKRYSEALADFDRALALGKQGPLLLAGRAMALEGLGRHAEADAAFAQANTGSAELPRHAQAQFHWARGFAIAGRLPEAARAAFDEALHHEPNCAQALYGRGYLAFQAGRQPEALSFFDQAATADPRLVEARRYRALLLARTGKLEAASRDINWCLEHEPSSGPTLYTAACVAALAVKRLGDPTAADQGLNLLEKALAQGVEGRNPAEDEDLAGIRDRPRFASLVAKYRTSFPKPGTE